MKSKLTEEFEKLMKKVNAKFVIVCITSEDGKCHEDFYGYCYHCGRNMLED